jgi:hypothetical protein
MWLSGTLVADVLITASMVGVVSAHRYFTDFIPDFVLPALGREKKNLAFREHRQDDHATDCP